MAYSEIIGKIGKKLPGMGAERAASYIDRGSRGAIKLARKAEGMVAKTASTARYGPEFAAQHRAAAISLRQRKVGGRYAAGALGVSGTMAMRPNSNQSRTAYRGPMQTGRGVGRFA